MGNLLSHGSRLDLSVTGILQSGDISTWRCWLLCEALLEVGVEAKGPLAHVGSKVVLAVLFFQRQVVSMDELRHLLID